MRYLLDANVIIALMNQSSTKVLSNFESAVLTKSEIYLSSIVLHELWFGVAKSGRITANAEVLRNFVAKGFETLPFVNTDAETAGSIRATLKIAGTPIGAYDTLIAGQALARDLTLVTTNTREFSRVSGLKLVDWTQG